jgi:phenylacetic acid degradation operon negative regulatory protein
LKDAWDRRYYREKRKMKFCEFIWKLKNGGYLRTLRVKDKTAIAITSKGMEKLFKIGLKTTNRKKRIDKKWQMILFDIPENKRKIRDSFRKALQYLGYKNLQKSIWVCPYDVEKETKILIKKYNLKPFVELLLVKKIGLG